MLILFLGSEYNAIKPMLGEPDLGKQHAIIVGQQGVFQLDKILNELSARTDIRIYVLKRDLQGSGLLSNFVGYDSLSIIEFDEFVSLTTQYLPCITIQ